MEIKGLYEALGVSEPERDTLRDMRVEAAAQRVMFYSRIVATGGNIHRSNPTETKKRRAANKAARKARRVNRERAA